MKKHVKITSTLLALLMLSLAFISCTGTSIRLHNQITAASLTSEELSIVSLLADTHNVDIFSFHVDENYTTLSLWIDVYEHGELVETSGGMELSLHNTPVAIESLDGQNPIGHIAVIRRQDGETHSWELVASIGGATIRSSFEFALATGGSVWVSLPDTTEIQANQDIILYMRLFGNGIPILGSMEEQMNTLSEISRAYVVRTRFS